MTSKPIFGIAAMALLASCASQPPTASSPRDGDRGQSEARTNAAPSPPPATRARPPLPVATYRPHDGYKNTYPFSQEFTQALRTLVKQPSRTFSRGGLRVKPAGFFALDGKEYAFYGFIAHAGRSWDAPVLRQFWKWDQWAMHNRSRLEQLRRFKPGLPPPTSSPRLRPTTPRTR